MSNLNELRAEIEEEAPDIGKRPYSHNIVRLLLDRIEEEFGQEEADKAIRDYHLKMKRIQRS